MVKELKNSKIIQIDYVNWRGERANRRIKPLKIWYGVSEWHKEKQWFIKAIDIEKEEERDFALKDVKKWISD